MCHTGIEIEAHPVEHLVEYRRNTVVGTGAEIVVGHVDQPNNDVHVGCCGCAQIRQQCGLNTEHPIVYPIWHRAEESNAIAEAFVVRKRIDDVVTEVCPR
jgi:hypothetical protein